MSNKSNMTLSKIKPLLVLSVSTVGIYNFEKYNTV